jgi:hypothetical protein
MDSFDIGRTFSRAFRLISGTLASVGVFLLLIQVVNVGIQFVLEDSMTGALDAARASGGSNAGLAIFSSSSYWVALASGLVLGAFSFGGSLQGMIAHDQGAKVSLAECIRVAVVKVLPVLALSILWYLGLILASILLIVPGIILGTMWSVCLPALVAENLGVFASFGRSRRLTKGSRIMIFVMLLIILVTYYVVVFAFFGAMLGSGNMMNMAEQMNGNVWLRLGTIPLGWVTSVLTSAFMASFYLEALLVKEGGTAGHLGEVFS